MLVQRDKESFLLQGTESKQERSDRYQIIEEKKRGPLFWGVSSHCYHNYYD